ncbi:MAG: sensor domain-containing diguanylate cyclase [Thermodesulfobacteriota bacterium]
MPPDPHRRDLAQQFDTLLALKNRQLEVIKELSLLTAEVADERTFVARMLPFLGSSLGTEEEILFYARLADGELARPESAAEQLAAVFAAVQADPEAFRQPRAISLAAPGTPPALAALARGGFGHCLLATVYHGDAVLGFLAVPARQLPVLTPDEALFLRYMSETLGVFLRTIRRNREFSSARRQLERSFRELSAVYEVSRAISGALDLEAILDQALDAILGQEILVLAARGAIFLNDPTSNRLRLARQRGLPPGAPAGTEPACPDDCLCGQAARGELIVSSLSDQEDPGHRHHRPGMPPHGHVVLPLRARSQVIGVLCLYVAEHQEPTPSQLNMLSAIANQLAMALENVRLYERIHHLSLHDPLTGLANRNMLQLRLAEEIKRASRFEEPLALAMLDIDHFKAVNDTFGHATGDAVLLELADLFREEMRASDVVARYGGEEFTILMPHTDLAQAQVALERLRQRVAEHPFRDAQGRPLPRPVTISIGLRQLPAGRTLPGAALLEEADRALYQAKAAGRNRVCS